MLKKLISLFVCLICFICTFTAAVTAARTGEFETQDVEFQAFVSNGVVEPIEITLTHVTDNYKLYYFLFSGNNYFSNEPVALGEYSVEVMVSGYEASEFNYDYDKTLKVERASTAINFPIIVDQALTDADYSGEPGTIPDTDLPTDISDVDDKGSDDSSDKKSSQDTQDSQEGHSTKSPYSLLISLAFSLLLLIVVAFVFWKIKSKM